MEHVEMRIGSLFSGIGGLELGLERGFRSAGVESRVMWQSEIDPTCRAILRRHWPDAELLGDVRTIRPSRVDLICGGFPCQDISQAGKGAGLAGARSGLWAQFARVVEIGRPSIVVIENVAALRSRGLGQVLSDLAALRYDAWWDCIPAAAVGAPHRRDRIYVVAWRVPDAERDGLWHESERGPGRTLTTDCWDALPEHVGAALADAAGGRCEGEWVEGQPWSRGQPSARWHEPDRCDRPRWPPRPDDMHAWRALPPDAQPAVCGVAHGVSRRVDRLRALGNAVVPEVAAVLGRAIATVITA